MKKKSAGLIMCVFMLLVVISGNAQDAIRLKSIVNPIPLAVGRHKAINLIFPYGIKSAYWVNQDLSVLQVKGLENVLMVNAKNESLKETNLTVATKNGALYSFIINFTPQPSLLNLDLGSNQYAAQGAGLLSPSSLNEAAITDNAEQLAARKPVIFNIRDRGNDMIMDLTGIYVSGDVMYFQLALENNSNLRYTIDQLRFFIKDQKKSKRTSSQEIQVRPLSVFGNQTAIEPRSRQALVFAVSKFTIPLNQTLHVQLLEKNGGRNLAFKIGNRTIVNAKPIN